MGNYVAPTINMMHALKVHGVEVDETLQHIFEAAAKFVKEKVLPLRKIGEENSPELNDGKVTVANDYAEAFKEFYENGYGAMQFPEEHGGLGLSNVSAAVISEMINAADPSFALRPLLNQGAVEALLHVGTPEQIERYVSKMLSGEYTGTMNLTEGNAGSDLGAMTTMATPQTDGTYNVVGEKIYITWGDHDTADNIIHLVLARTPDAPEGNNGISLFIVPKILEDGSENDLKCSGLEEKLGIHGSPTCTMKFGETKGATGYLLGNLGEGLKNMFIMMNNARLSVGVQGLAAIESAYQHSYAYANEREQFGTKIIDFPDVQNMLLQQKATAEAARFMATEAFVAMDNGETKKVGFMTPIVKSWCTDMGSKMSDLGMQVFGGMGFIEESGAPQIYRDSRIFRIYEGTNGIQGIDLVGRKIAKDGGEALDSYVAEMKGRVSAYQGVFEPYFEALEEAKAYILEHPGQAESMAAATQFQNGLGTLAAATLMAKSLDVAQAGDNAKLAEEQHITTNFFIDKILPSALADLKACVQGNDFTTKAVPAPQEA